jgi:CheY-like chemotaxis protein
MSVTSGPPSEARDLPARPWVVLFVDDEPDILESLSALFAASLPGATVVIAPSGRAGLDLLAKQTVDLIVSDFRMPGMDGVEFLSRCRRLYPKVPRVMLTAFPSEELANQAVREAFVDSFLSKAMDPDKLLAEVASLVKGLQDGTARKVLDPGKPART